MQSSVCNCSRQNIGRFSKLDYDKCATIAAIKRSVGPGTYKINPNQIFSLSQGFSAYGPRPGYMGNGVSTPIGQPPATALYLVDVDSIMTNRNMRASKCNRGEVNPVNFANWPEINLPPLSRYLDPIATHLTNPPFNYKSVPIDRFYTLHYNPQDNIFWNFARNTTLEAKDAFNINNINTLSSNQ